MKLSMTKAERIAFIKQHDGVRRPWFAWHPVKLDDGSVVWLETVIRYRVYFDEDGGDIDRWAWVYKRQYKGGV